MSMYNMLSGFNVNASLCLAMLGIDTAIIPRFRNAWLSNDGSIITIMTRTGGGNRDEYDGSNIEMTYVAGYLRDFDDAFDATYAQFEYAVPSRFIADTKLIAEAMLAVSRGAESNEVNATVERALSALRGDEQHQHGITADDPRIVAASDAIARIMADLGVST